MTLWRSGRANSWATRRLHQQRLTNAEWTGCYNKAIESFFAAPGSWHSRGLVPLYLIKVSCHLPRPCAPLLTTGSSISVTLFDSHLITSPPPDAVNLHLTTAALNKLVSSRGPTPFTNSGLLLVDMSIASLCRTINYPRILILTKEIEQFRGVVASKRIKNEGRILLSIFGDTSGCGRTGNGNSMGF